MIIGLIGYAQSGKDTVASILIERYGFERRAFADKIRDILYDMNPIVSCSPSGYLQDLVNLVGWDEAKQEPQVRKLLQNLGVACRTHIDTDVWVDAAMNTMDVSKNYVITDVRFLNEIDRLRSARATIWRVTRPGVGPVNQHVSETELASVQADETIYNDGDKNDLLAKVIRTLDSK